MALLYGGRFADARAFLRDLPDPALAAAVEEEIGLSVDALDAQCAGTGFLYRAQAPRYLDHGPPVIPFFGKRPVPAGWDRWSTSMPEPEDTRRWMDNAWAGIGLVVGPQAGVVVMDIDARDPATAATIERALPPSPWRRVGRYGAALVCGPPWSATTRIASGSTTCSPRVA